MNRKEKIAILQERANNLAAQIEANPKVSFLPVLKAEFSAMRWAIQELSAEPNPFAGLREQYRTGTMPPPRNVGQITAPHRPHRPQIKS
jgi:hypothetical protein